MQRKCRRWRSGQKRSAERKTPQDDFAVTCVQVPKSISLFSHFPRHSIYLALHAMIPRLATRGACDEKSHDSGEAPKDEAALAFSISFQLPDDGARTTRRTRAFSGRRRNVELGEPGSWDLVCKCEGKRAKTHFFGSENTN